MIYSHAIPRQVPLFKKRGLSSTVLEKHFKICHILCIRKPIKFFRFSFCAILSLLYMNALVNPVSIPQNVFAGRWCQWGLIQNSTIPQAGFFQILWKSRCNILVSFPSHLKKLCSILRFWLEKLNCGFFHSFHSRKNTTKQLF